jgi:3-deoxy-7-phosphoheptulonate synthase
VILATPPAPLVDRLAGAAIAAGADGLLIDVHGDPSSALSDGEQALTFAEFAQMVPEAAAVAAAVGRRIGAAIDIDLHGTERAS